MKSISASIIVVCATALVIAAAYHQHGDTSMFLSICGVAIGVVGMIGWFRSLKEPELPGTDSRHHGGST